jgi:hypothetical protein
MRACAWVYVYTSHLSQTTVGAFGVLVPLSEQEEEHGIGWKQGSLLNGFFRHENSKSTLHVQPAKPNERVTRRCTELRVDAGALGVGLALALNL